VALMIGLVTFVLSCLLVANFDHTQAGIQFARTMWITSLKITYSLGVDGLNLIFIPLTALLFLLCIVASWDRHRRVSRAIFPSSSSSRPPCWEPSRRRICFSCSRSGLRRCCDLLHDGRLGNVNREYAATKFFLYQLAGGALSFWACWPSIISPSRTASAWSIWRGKFTSARIDVGGRSLGVEHLVFILMLIGFAVRLPVVPLHSWFPHVQAEAPPALAVISRAFREDRRPMPFVRVNYALFPEAANWAAPVLATLEPLTLFMAASARSGKKTSVASSPIAASATWGSCCSGWASSPRRPSTARSSRWSRMAPIRDFCSSWSEFSGALGPLRHREPGWLGRLRRTGLASAAPHGRFTVAVYSALGVPGAGARETQSAEAGEPSGFTMS